MLTPTLLGSFIFEGEIIGALVHVVMLELLGLGPGELGGVIVLYCLHSAVHRAFWVCLTETALGWVLLPLSDKQGKGLGWAAG